MMMIMMMMNWFILCLTNFEKLVMIDWAIFWLTGSEKLTIDWAILWLVVKLVLVSQNQTEFLVRFTREDLKEKVTVPWQGRAAESNERKQKQIFHQNAFIMKDRTRNKTDKKMTYLLESEVNESRSPRRRKVRGALPSKIKYENNIQSVQSGLVWRSI